jgi:probable phosphoglycerate mutase
MTQAPKNDSSERLFEPLEARAAKTAGWITAHCDGGSRGNPGPSGYGVHIQDEAGQAVAELSEFLGKRTNNYAEYSGLLAALNFALENGHPRLRVVSDSELMVKQIKGQYRVNSPDLKPLYDEARRRIARLDQFRIEHVLRGKNQHADRLANLAMDRGTAARGAAAPAPTDRASSGRGPTRSPGDFRAAVKAVAGAAAGPTVPAAKPAPPPARPLRGLVKGGVVHLLEGELPEGIFVRVAPEPK